MTTRWYAVHAYSNFENKVADSIREQAKQRSGVAVDQVGAGGGWAWFIPDLTNTNVG